MPRRVALVAAAAIVACQPDTSGGGKSTAHEVPPPAALSRVDDAPAPTREGDPDNPYGPPGRVANHFAYIPSQCYAKTQLGRGKRARNPCYTCHTNTAEPNFVADGDLQLVRRLPRGARQNHWANLFNPATERTPLVSDEEIERFVRQSNYIVDGHLVLADALRTLPSSWDGQGDGKWDGYVPDVWYHFDDQGFDRRPDGTPSGWRAFSYYPLPGAFLPTNGGSAGDVLIRLDSALQQSAAGEAQLSVYLANLAIVEALVRQADVAVDALDERAMGADLDKDGHLGIAHRVVFAASQMHYVGKARALEDAGQFPIAPGLFPVGTEFFHSVRYLDVAPTGEVVPAEHFKEVRYAKKVRWYDGSDLRAVVLGEAREQAKTEDQSHPVLWAFDHGIDNGQGWYLQGFIESSDGSLRPQTFEETAYCAGCHGGVGRTTDSIFSFSRKLPAEAPSRGWFHFTQHSLAGMAEPRSPRGEYEYSQYLQETRGDDYAENDEVRHRFFEEDGAVRRAAMAHLHDDVTFLLLPGPERALALDRAYLAIVREQSFLRGRDTIITAVKNVVATASPNERTGVRTPIRLQ